MKRFIRARKDGRFFERYVTSQQVDGKRAGLVISFRDTPARRQAEILELPMRAQTA